MSKQKIRLYSEETLEYDYIQNDNGNWKRTGKITPHKSYKIQFERREKNLFGNDKHRTWTTYISTDNKEEAIKAFEWIKENNEIIKTEILDSIEI